MKTCFLLGSGISVPAGLPKVADITQEALSSEGYQRDSDGFFRTKSLCKTVFDAVAGQRTADLERVQTLLKWLRVQAATRYHAQPSRQVNYEDLAYMAGQIQDDFLENFENPAITPFVNGALSALWHLFADNERPPSEQFADLAGEATDYIRDIVKLMLNKPPTETKHLSLFLEAARDPKVQELNLFSLNHDTVLEEYLRLQQSAVIVNDGFNPENDLGIRRWNPSLFDSSPNPRSGPTTRLFKLHGSVDWWAFQPRLEGSDEQTESAGQTKPWQNEYVGIRSNPELSKKKDPNGKKHGEVRRPLLLAGTFNKMLDYINGVFLELHYRFHRTLAESTELIVCGYGFGDKGINTRITEWMCPCGETSRKLLIIDMRSFEKVRQTSRGAIAGKLALWEDEGRLAFWEHPLGSKEVSWNRIAEDFLNL